MSVAEIVKTDRSLAISRIYNAPRELVFAAWKDPKHIGNWWGPIGFKTTTEVMDFRSGGKWRFVMHGPDGVDYPNLIVYKKIIEPELITYAHSGESDHDKVRFDSTVTFEAIGKKTKLTLKMVFEDPEVFNMVMETYGAQEGGKQTLSRLAQHLFTIERKHKMALETPNDLDFVLRRSFDAPKALVFDCWTKPEHLRRWWGCGFIELAGCEVDLRVGGKWRYVMKQEDGQENPLHGEFLDIDIPNKLVYTYIFDVPVIRDHPATVTVTFEEKDGVTTVTETTRHDSIASRDGHIASGVEGGARVSFNHLEALLNDLIGD